MKLTIKQDNSSIKWGFIFRSVILIGLFIVLGSEFAAAQPPPPPGGTGGPPCWPPPCIPIDGGIGWLLAAGIAFGAKKSFDLGKSAKED